MTILIIVKFDTEGVYMNTITPCLWFDSNAEEAVNFYISIFRNSRIKKIARYGDAGHEIHKRPSGSVLTIEFELNGQTFTALNGGPLFRFNEAISFQVACESQEEIDYYWDKLSESGDKNAQQCGWLKDKFGVSWQIVPSVLKTMLVDNDPARTNRVMSALLEMKKLDLATLKNAFENK